MSLYTIAAATLTTPDDFKRRPAMSGGMTLRALVLCLLFAVALVALYQTQAATGF